jgi:hypothetical protein
MKLEFSQQIFKKYSNTKLHENPSSGSQVVSLQRTDITKVTVTFCNFANTPKNVYDLLPLRTLHPGISSEVLPEIRKFSAGIMIL